MTVLINLEDHAREVEAFAGLADDFIDKSSSLRMDQVLKDLLGHIDNGVSAWTWETPRRIRFRASTAYDGPGRTFPDTVFELGFSFRFERPAGTKSKCKVWSITHGATHVFLDRADGCGAFHFDYKNPGQWGPQVHFQVAEDHTNLPIPRILAPTFLPTDCADLMLMELHTVEWEQAQAQQRASTHVSTLREAQEHRALHFVGDIGRQWGQVKNKTRVAMLQSYSTGLSALPDRKGKPAVLS